MLFNLSLDDTYMGTKATLNTAADRRYQYDPNQAYYTTRIDVENDG
jgi:hypothetical protein